MTDVPRASDGRGAGSTDAEFFREVAAIKKLVKAPARDLRGVLVRWGAEWAAPQEQKENLFLRARRAVILRNVGPDFGPLRFRSRPDEERKIRFRETLKPLKSLKTAKSWLLRPGLIKG